MYLSAFRNKSLMKNILSNLYLTFFYVLVYIPLKYDTILSYIHCLLCLW
jgi:hypothetical protein